MERHAFRAMGTEVELLLDAPPGVESVIALAAARREIDRLEALLSRFRPDSELSRLNAAGRLAAGPELLEVVQLALAARERTGGRFDPTVHDALVAAGYDRSFELVAARGAAPAAAPARCGGDVRVDAAAGVVELEPGFRLDLGGIAKGWIVDRACALLARAGACLVNAGGDLAVRGGAWPVGVDAAEGRLTLELTAGALATSGSDRRRWPAAGGEAHHLIDARTGAPAESDLVRATALAATAAEAEVLAKELYLLGEGAALAAGATCVLVTVDGRTVRGGELA